MKIWTVWFSDCFSTTYKSCSVFLLPPKLVEVYETWIIVWTWALNWFGSPKPNLPFWANKIYLDFLKGPDQHGESLFSSFLGNWFQLFSYTPIRDHDWCRSNRLIPLLYNLELISIFSPNKGQNKVIIRTYLPLYNGAIFLLSYMVLESFTPRASLD